MIPYKSRTFNLDTPVLVYRNLNKNCWSIKQNNLIIAHAESLVLHNFQCIIKEAGRNRVLKENHKNVHAFLLGHIVTYNIETPTKTITYNPYKFNYFYDKETFEPIYSGQYAFFLNGFVKYC